MFEVETCLYRYGRSGACPKKGESRGLCRSHYITAASLVKRRLVTWEELEARGKAVPVITAKRHHRGRPPLVTEWFLSPEPVFPIPEKLKLQEGGS